jgi:hypothetical protein
LLTGISNRKPLVNRLSNRNKANCNFIFLNLNASANQPIREKNALFSGAIPLAFGARAFIFKKPFEIETFYLQKIVAFWL